MLRIWSLYYAPFRMDWEINSPAPYMNRVWFRGAMLGLFFAGCVILGWFEYTQSILSGWIMRILERPLLQYVFLFVLFAALNSQLLLPGNPVATDGVGHVHLVWLIREYIRGVELPLWTNYSWMGYPLSYAGSQLYHVITAFVSLAFRDVNQASKVAIVTFHALSGISMYAYVRHLTRGNRWAGLIGGLAYSLSFYHYRAELFSGRHSMSLFMALLPLVLLLIERTIDRPTRRNAGLLTLSLLAVLQTHLSFGIMALVFMVLYAMVRLVTQHITDRNVTRRHWLMLIGSMAVSVIVFFAQIIPTLSDLPLFFTLGQMFQGTFVLGTVSWQEIFIFESSVDLHVGYIGVSLFVLATIAVVVGIRQKLPAVVALMVLLATGLFFSLGPEYLPFFDTFFNTIPLGSLIYVVKSSGYYLFHVMLTASALAGLAITAEPQSKMLWKLSAILPVVAVLPLLIRLADRLSNLVAIALIVMLTLMAVGVVFMSRLNSRVPAWPELLSLTILADLFPLTFQSPAYLSEQTYLHNRDVAYQIVREQVISSGRVLDLGIGNANYQSVIETGTSCLACGGHEMVQARVGEFASWLRREIRDGQPAISHVALNGLYLADVSHVIGDQFFDNPWVILPAGDSQAGLMAFPHSPLVIASNTTVDPRTSYDYEEILSNLSIDTVARRVDVIPLREALPIPDWASDAETADITLIDHQEGLSTYTVDFELTAPAFIHVAYAYWPQLRVEVDGEAVPFTETVFGTIGLWVPAGDHHLEIIPRLTLLQRWLTVLSLALLAMLVVVLVIPERRRESAQHTKCS